MEDKEEEEEEIELLFVSFGHCHKNQSSIPVEAEQPYCTHIANNTGAPTAREK